MPLKEFTVLFRSGNTLKMFCEPTASRIPPMRYHSSTSVSHFGENVWSSDGLSVALENRR